MNARYWKTGRQLWGARKFFQGICHRNKKDFINLFSSAADGDSEDSYDKPIKFSISKAARWKAHYTHSGEHTNSIPDSQPYAVMGSVTIFFIYFALLREENDLDDMLRAAETGVPIEVEEATIKVIIEYNEGIGEDATELKNRLAEIQKMK